MSPTSLSLLILALVLFGVMALLVMLVRHITQMTESTSAKLSDFQTTSTDLMIQQADQAHETARSLLQQQLESQSNLLQPLLNQTEILVNRLLAKDAIAVQALDVRVAQEKNLGGSEYVSGTDKAEAERYEALTHNEEFGLDAESGLGPLS